MLELTSCARGRAPLLEEAANVLSPCRRCLWRGLSLCLALCVGAIGDMVKTTLAQPWSPP